MPRQREFYDPEVQVQHATAMRGFAVTIGGTYVLLDDVVTALREYAQSLSNPDHGALVHELATWLRSGEQPSSGSVQEPGQEQPVADDPVTSGVDRIEVYPDDPLSPEPRWVARGCSDEGDILSITNGSFDQDAVIADAQARWPNADVHLLSHAGIDTVWEERDPGGIRSSSSGQRRPSPKRLFA